MEKFSSKYDNYIILRKFQLCLKITETVQQLMKKFCKLHLKSTLNKYREI
jgi:hypothetical protein